MKFGITKNNSLDSYITSLLRETREAKHRKKNIHARLAAYCPKQNYYYAHSDEKVDNYFDEKSKIYMGIGNGVSKTLENEFRRNKVLIDCERKVSKTILGTEVSGYIDYVIKDQNNETRGIELKTCGKLPSSPKREHLYQAITYMLLEELDKFSLVYVSRNVVDSSGNLAIKTFDLDNLDESIKQEAINRIILSAYAVKNNYLPKTKPTDVSCYYCPFYKICDKKKDELLENQDYNLVRKYIDNGC